MYPLVSSAQEFRLSPVHKYLKTDEFVGNPPLSKNKFGGSNIAVQFPAGTIRVCLKFKIS